MDTESLNNTPLLNSYKLYFDMCATRLKKYMPLAIFLLLFLIMSPALSFADESSITYGPGDVKSGGIDSTGGVTVTIASPSDQAAIESGSLSGSGIINITVGVDSGFPTLKLRGVNTGFTGSLNLTGGTLNINNNMQLIAQMSNFKFNSDITKVYDATDLKDLIKKYAGDPSEEDKILLNEALAQYELAIAAAHANGNLGVLQIEAGSNIAINGNNGATQRITVNGGKAGGLVLDSGATLTFTGHTGSALLVEDGGLLDLKAGESAKYVFTGNSALVGAAISNAGMLSLNSAEFTNNSATQTGGAVLNQATGIMIVNNSVFTGNSAKEGGAIYNLGVMNIGNTGFSNNTSSQAGGAAGGAIYLAGGNLTVTSTTFSGNQGSAVYNEDARLPLITPFSAKTTLRPMPVPCTISRIPIKMPS